MSDHYSIEWESEATEQLERVDEVRRAKVLRKVRDQLANDPTDWHDADRLTGPPGNLWRIQTRDYRIFYVIDEGRRVVTICRLELPEWRKRDDSDDDRIIRVRRSS